jgi:hypothetical protein
VTQLSAYDKRLSENLDNYRSILSPPLPDLP